MEFPALATVVLLIGILIGLAQPLQAGAKRLRLPALIVFILLGLTLRWLDKGLGESLRLLSAEGEGMLELLASIGVIFLLFRIGLQSDLTQMRRELRRATPIWLGNIVISAVAAYLTARWFLGWDQLASMLVGAALTATSVGVPAAVWQERQAASSPQGQLFVDVAEMDDISGVILMSLVLAVMPVLEQQPDRIWSIIGWESLQALGLLLLFLAACAMHARWLQQPMLRFLKRLEPDPDQLLSIVALALVVAAIAGLLGFSLAIGAFFAGVMLSGNESVCRHRALTALYDLFTPFFFIGIGLKVDPGSLTTGLWLPLSALLSVAVLAKYLGTVVPALPMVDRRTAHALGLSMIPRAEIALIVASNGLAMGGIISDQQYTAIVMTAILTCLLGGGLLHQAIPAEWSEREAGNAAVT